MKTPEEAAEQVMGWLATGRSVMAVRQDVRDWSLDALVRVGLGVQDCLIDAIAGRAEVAFDAKERRDMAVMIDAIEEEMATRRGRG